MREQSVTAHAGQSVSATVSAPTPLRGWCSRSLTPPRSDYRDQNSDGQSAHACSPLVPAVGASCVRPDRRASTWHDHVSGGPAPGWRSATHIWMISLAPIIACGEGIARRRSRFAAPKHASDDWPVPRRFGDVTREAVSVTANALIVTHCLYSVRSTALTCHAAAGTPSQAARWRSDRPGRRAPPRYHLGTVPAPADLAGRMRASPARFFGFPFSVPPQVRASAEASEGFEPIRLFIQIEGGVR